MNVFPIKKEVATPIKMVNDAFNVLNSRTPYLPLNPIVGAVGTSYDEQLKTINKIEVWIRKLLQLGLLIPQGVS